MGYKTGKEKGREKHRKGEERREGGKRNRLAYKRGKERVGKDIREEGQSGIGEGKRKGMETKEENR